MFQPLAFHHCDGQVETGDQSHGRGKRSANTELLTMGTMPNVVLCISNPDPARLEGTNGNHE